MKPAILCLAAALFMGISAAPVAAQSNPLTLEEEQLVTEIRDRDRETFISAAGEAGLKNQFGIVKPIAKWTYDDYREFLGHYQEELVKRGAGNPDGTISTLEAAFFIQNLLQFGSGGADGGGGDGD